MTWTDMDRIVAVAWVALWVCTDFSRATEPLCQPESLLPASAKTRVQPAKTRVQPAKSRVKPATFKADLRQPSRIAGRTAVSRLESSAPPLYEPKSFPETAKLKQIPGAKTVKVDTVPKETPGSSGVVQAVRLAHGAKTREELARVIDVCRQAATTGESHASHDNRVRIATWAANRRGELAAAGGDEQAAISDFEQALQFDPYNWQAIHNRGVSHALRGERYEAMADFERAIELNPRCAAAFRNRGELRMDLGLTNAAIKDYTQAIEIEPDDGELRRIRGHALHRLGRYKAAVHDFNAAIRLVPASASAYTDRGNAYAELGYYHHALRDFRKALQLDADYAPAYRAVAWVLATCPEKQYRRPEKALVAARRALVLAESVDPLDFDALAAAQAGAGQFQAAVTTQERAVELAGVGPIVRQLRQRLALYRRGKAFRSTPREISLMPSRNEKTYETSK